MRKRPTALSFHAPTSTLAVGFLDGDVAVYRFNPEYGEVTMEQIEEIAKIKLPDLNTNKLQSAMNTVMGTAKNMGSACYAIYNLQLLPPAM